MHCIFFIVLGDVGKLHWNYSSASWGKTTFAPNCAEIGFVRAWKLIPGSLLRARGYESRSCFALSPPPPSWLGGKYIWCLQSWPPLVCIQPLTYVMKLKQPTWLHLLFGDPPPGSKCGLLIYMLLILMGAAAFFWPTKLPRGDGPFRKSWSLTGLEGALEEEQAWRGCWQVW